MFLTSEPKMFILTKGNDVVTVNCNDFLKDVYPKLLKGWSIITKTGAVNGNVQTP